MKFSRRYGRWFFNSVVEKAIEKFFQERQLRHRLRMVAQARYGNPSRAQFAQTVFTKLLTTGGFHVFFWPAVREDGTSYISYSILAPHSFTLWGVYIEVDRFRRKLWDCLERPGFQYVSVHQSCGCLFLCKKRTLLVSRCPKKYMTMCIERGCLQYGATE